jgi:AcrR family transcriptional regulator
MVGSARPTAKGITREQIVEAAWRIITTQGVHELSMRKLASAVGVQPTTVYWHVGNRDAVVDAVVAHALQEIPLSRSEGNPLPDRLYDMAQAVRAELVARPALLELLASEDRVALFFVPLVTAFLRELTEAGIGGDAAVELMRSLLIHVMGFVLVERRLPGRGPEVEGPAFALVGLDHGEGEGDQGLRPGGADLDRLFDHSVHAHIGALLDRVHSHSR